MFAYRVNKYICSRVHTILDYIYGSVLQIGAWIDVRDINIYICVCACREREREFYFLLYNTYILYPTVDSTLSEDVNKSKDL